MNCLAFGGRFCLRASMTLRIIFRDRLSARKVRNSRFIVRHVQYNQNNKSRLQFLAKSRGIRALAPDTKFDTHSRRGAISQNKPKRPFAMPRPAQQAFPLSQENQKVA